jgi:hypothetical protein
MAETGFHPGSIGDRKDEFPGCAVKKTHFGYFCETNHIKDKHHKLK